MKAKFGMFMTAGVGKVGGNVVQRNRYGTFARSKVTPANPQTTPQQERRAWLASLTAAWQALNFDQQDLWVRETDNYPRTDAFGDTYFMSGFNLFVSLNINLLRVSASTIDVPLTKTLPTVASPITVKVDSGSQAFEIIFDVGPNDPKTAIIVFATAGVSPGINYVSTRLRSIVVIPADGTDDWILSTEYNAYFSPFLASQRVFAKCEYINLDCGASVPGSIAFGTAS